jgi:diguanylate cyclase (GGDEF)-like protein/PAS domain S-box-containing protein
MTESLSPIAGAGLPVDDAVPLVQLNALLDELNHDAPRGSISPPVLSTQVDNRLAQVRLGTAASLYAALRFRCASAATHSLRVALSCSAWAGKMQIVSEMRDAIEVAALLHDVGVIGVPDQILLKPGPLDADEHLVFEQSRRMSAEIVRASCADHTVIAIVENLGAWFDGSHGGFTVSGEHIPLGARMVAIVEAFDAMTTDHVFRRAMSEERALRELFACAGRQFDPLLVRDFGTWCVGDQTDTRRGVARRWLHTLDPEAANAFWEWNATEPAASGERTALFEDRLLDNMHDAVAFIDASMRIALWNHGAERLTGIATESVRQRCWSPSMLNLQNEKGDWVGEEDCPVFWALRSGTQSLRRLTISGRGGRPVPVDSHAIPVSSSDGTPAGVVLLLHDASSEITLEERCQSLHEKAIRDPLTQVANRAEFDRVLEMFVRAHNEQQVPCALVICDLDRFKQVNDNFGHQAGDDVIKCLANLLRDACRAGDLVARYGGEEFVLLCADCNNATAVKRAEQVRKRLSRIPVPKLEGRLVSASFGVTEVQAGDTPETMLRRADRALLLAKERGRNRVVQLGVGAEEDEKPRAGFMAWWRGESSPPLVLEEEMVTPVPVAVAVEKLRGFVADHRAQILKIDANHVQLQIQDVAGALRRSSDRPIAFFIELDFEEEHLENGQRAGGATPPVAHTRVHAAIHVQKGRDRRQADIARRGRELLASVRSYLIAQTELAGEQGMLRRASKILTPWLLKR